MAEDRPSSPHGDAAALDHPPPPAPSNVNLQIVSPSVGVNAPLSFPGLASSATVGQLKEKIRESLPLRPADDQQRLIHRGRLLARDSDTLQDVFGEEMLRTGDQQTLHLVLRDLGDHDSRSHTPSRATPVRGLSPPAPVNGPPQPQPHPHHHHHHHPHHRTHPLRNATPALPNPALAQFMQTQQQQHNQYHLQQHQTWLQWMNQLQREAGYRQLLAQQQRDRAALGYQGIQDTGNGPHVQGQTDQANGRSPSLAAVDGIRRRMTPSEAFAGPSTTPLPAAGPTSNPLPRGALSPADVHNILRGADTTQATQTITNAMHRSASGASLASMAGNLANINGPIQPIQPGVTTPLYPGGSRHVSRTATPDPSVRSVSHGSGSMPAVSQNQLPSQPPQAQPEVYILSSPTGPRGLLINTPADMYVTPAIRPVTTFQPHFPGARPFNHWATYLPTPPVQPHHHHAAQPQPQQVQVPGHQQVQHPRPQVQLRVQQNFRIGRPVQAHPNNPGAGALMAAAWPHVWLVIRLVIFVWWFTSGDASWSRWLAMVAIAIVVFVVNTGILDGVVNQAWNPLRQHLEGLLPLGDGNQGQRDAAAAPAAGQQQQPLANIGDAAVAGAVHGHGHNPPQGNPDPAQVAARLVARRRHDNANWLLDQVRRMERAGLLFLASIAPGVAERHIAHLEAQERAAERQRREAEEAAAAAAAEAEAARAVAAGETEQQQSDGTGQQQDDAGQGDEQSDMAPAQQQQQPLIQV
ncbi:ubiquitin family protein [Apodospora peruviana]|uniref:Ubiquitin family protein n=1 Tax=Apodospora peruviana TaxID=516989 RepID=A0AAE0IHR1_9PEZI|nr:ubiquitin family protein [Apodospora peruviana]